MALFGSDKKSKSSLKKVRPTVIRTQNVAKELQSIARSYELSVDSLDFNILEIQTYSRMNDGTKETEWEDMNENEISQIEEATFLNKSFQIKQIYEVEIFSKNDANDPYKKFKLAVGANATKCKVYLSIGAGSEVSYSPSLETDIEVLIKKRKIRSGILVDMFDGMMESVISKLSAHIRVEEKAVYNKSQTILIAEGYEPTETVNDALILHYEKKEDTDEKQKIDYASRGFIQNVKENELLIEYIKPQKGKPGRNCRGEYMDPSEPTINFEPSFNIGDTIKKVETEESIQYLAKENGYIALEENTYLIKTDVDVGEISFKTTGSIATGIDSDVSISVKETDAVKDAVGTGMSVEVTEIEIDGNVGSNASVTAKKASIGGQTHKTAIIKADQLDINVHKGKATGKNIHITRLEHGEVTGDIVEIHQALGGVIHAKEIEIGVCASYVKATASRLIEIKKLQGSENIFTIDPLLKKDAQEGLDENKENIAELKTSIRDLKKEISEYSQKIKDGTPAFKEIKKRLVHYKKNGVKMPASFISKYKQFQKMQEHLLEIKNEFALKTDQMKLLTTRTASFQDDIFDARVINRGAWLGFNEIRFKLVNPAVELSYKPAEGSNDKVFGLVDLGDGEFEIQPLKE
jgi:uncharacterized protein (DUF342 family)